MGKHHCDTTSTQSLSLACSVERTLLILCTASRGLGAETSRSAPRSRCPAPRPLVESASQVTPATQRQDLVCDVEVGGRLARGSCAFDWFSRSKVSARAPPVLAVPAARRPAQGSRRVGGGVEEGRGEKAGVG
eukprot:92216-Rhodomonas_salina.3